MSKSATPVKPVALIAGPTASGKSDLAVRLALALKAAGRESVVINADSAQVYADLQVLSARPTEAEMGGVPHRLFGTWDGAEACSAVDWSEAAKREIAQAHAADAVPILVGGTGLYIRTLLEGIAPVPEIDAGIREEVRSMPVEQAHAALQAEDPERAALLNPGDSQRIARALEVVRSTGRTLGDWQQHLEGGIGDSITLAPLVILPDRDWLNSRCDKRFELMLDNGAVGEVEALLARQLPDTLPVMRAIGVPQLAGFLQGDLSHDEAIAAGQLATRQYAKRQYTWLRNQLPEHWPRMEPENIQIRAQFDILFSN